jgi:hypothetical protein
MRLRGKFTPNTKFEGVSYFTLTVLDESYKKGNSKLNEIIEIN